MTHSSRRASPARPAGERLVTQSLPGFLQKPPYFFFAQKQKSKRTHHVTFRSLPLPPLGHRPLQFQGKGPAHIPIAKNPGFKHKFHRFIAHFFAYRRIGDNPMLRGGTLVCPPPHCPTALLSVSISSVTLGLEGHGGIFSESFSFLRYFTPPADCEKQTFVQIGD